MIYLILIIFLLFAGMLIFSFGRKVGNLEERAKSSRGKSVAQKQKAQVEEAEYEEIK